MLGGGWPKKAVFAENARWNWYEKAPLSQYIRRSWHKKDPILNEAGIEKAPLLNMVGEGYMKKLFSLKMLEGTGIRKVL